MSTTKTSRFFIILLAGFLLVFGLLLTLTVQTKPSELPPIIPEPKPSEEKEKKTDSQELEESHLSAVNLSYEADISKTAIDEMEEGRFIVETELPGGNQRKVVFGMLRSRGGIIVVRDIDDRYFLLQSNAPRQLLAESAIPLESYALHRPGRISHQGLSLMGITTAEAGDIPYLVMPKNFEARIISEIERALPHPLEQYAGAKLRLEPTPGGHLRMQIQSVTQRDRSTVAIHKTVPGL